MAFIGNKPIMAVIINAVGEAEKRIDQSIEKAITMSGIKTFTILDNRTGETITCVLGDFDVTWEDWVKSDYNVIGAYIDDSAYASIDGRIIRSLSGDEQPYWDWIYDGSQYMIN